MLKSILSVVIGYTSMIGLSKISHLILNLVSEKILLISLNESVPILLVYLAITTVISGFSGYLTVKFSSHSALRHDLVLAVILMIQGIIVMGTDTVIPAWWHTCYVMMLIPTILLGGYSRMRQIHKEKHIND